MGCGRAAAAQDEVRFAAQGCQHACRLLACVTVLLQQGMQPFLKMMEDAPAVSAVSGSVFMTGDYKCFCNERWGQFFFTQEEANRRVREEAMLPLFSIVR